MTIAQLLNAVAAAHGDRFTSAKTYNLTETLTLVAEDDPASRYLLVAAGAELPLVVAMAVGLTGTPGQQVTARRAIEAGEASILAFRAT